MEPETYGPPNAAPSGPQAPPQAMPMPYVNPYAGPGQQAGQPGQMQMGQPVSFPTAGAVYPGYQSPEQFPSKPAPQSFSGAAITGMVIVTIIWALALWPLLAWLLAGGVQGVGILDTIPVLGFIALIGSVGGFIAALASGHKKLAARLYIIPCLVWLGGIMASIMLLLFLLGFSG